jgi:hypothetical protein
VWVWMQVWVCVCTGTSVGQLVPFCEVNVAPGITGMVTGWGLLVFGGLVFPFSPLGQISEVERFFPDDVYYNFFVRTAMRTVQCEK